MPLHYTAPPLPDESLLSWVARTREQAALPRRGNFLSEKAFSSYRFVNYAVFLSSQLPGKAISPRQLIRQKCIYPFYAPFIPPRYVRSHLRYALKGIIGKNTLVRSDCFLSPPFARLCPDCIEEDIKAFGEPYYHRRHQLPGIAVCLKHELKLHQSGICFRFPKTARLVVTEEAIQRISVTLHRPLSAFLQESLDELFNRDCFRNDPHQLRAIYRHLGKFSYRTTERQLSPLLTQLEKDYLSLNPDLSTFPSLKKIIQRSLAKNDVQLPPVINLLLLFRLGLFLSTALSYNRRSLWACPNGLCDAYGLFELEPPVRMQKGYRLTCRRCSMMFSISQASDIGSTPRVMRYLEPGTFFERKVAELYQSKPSVNAIAKRAKTGHVLIESILKRAGFALSPSQSIANDLTPWQRFEQYKAAILQWISDHPKGTSSELKRVLPNEFDTLRRNTPDWCNENFPKDSSKRTWFQIGHIAHRKGNRKKAD